MKDLPNTPDEADLLAVDSFIANSQSNYADAIVQRVDTNWQEPDVRRITEKVRLSRNKAELEQALHTLRTELTDIFAPQREVDRIVLQLRNAVEEHELNPLLRQLRAQLIKIQKSQPDLITDILREEDIPYVLKKAFAERVRGSKGPDNARDDTAETFTERLTDAEPIEVKKRPSRRQLTPASKTPRDAHAR